MIAFLPSSPWNACVTRIDWMISLSLRSAVRLGSWTSSAGEQARTDELLGDRRGAAAVAAQRVEAGRDDRDGIEAGVLPEGLVLDRRGGVDDDRRDLVERHDVALRVAEPRELHLAGPVVDDRLLGEDGLVHVRGRLEVIRRERRVRADDRDRADRAEAGEEGQDDQPDPATRAWGWSGGRGATVDERLAARRTDSGWDRQIGVGAAIRMPHVADFSRPTPSSGTPGRARRDAAWLSAGGRRPSTARTGRTIGVRPVRAA